MIGRQQGKSVGPWDGVTVPQGVSRRDWFAIECMTVRMNADFESLTECAESAVIAADALIAELDRTGNATE